MVWLQVEVDTTTEKVEHVSAELLTLGALSITLQDAADQPIYEPSPSETPLWMQTRVTGLFSTETVELSQLQTQLQEWLTPLAIAPYRLYELVDQDWSQIWRADFQPRQFGTRLWVCPTECAPPDPLAITVLLDPGLAFGTGTHATTALCLEWLEQQTDLQGKTLIDYGCGSGILAIAAVKLGAARVLAVDHDPQALLATQANAEKNGVKARLDIVTPEQLPSCQVDGIIANILAIPLCQLAKLFARYTTIHGFIVLAGILEEQAPTVISHYTPYFTINETTEREGWIRLVGRKI